VTDDPFAVLGLPPTAGVADVVAARRRLAKKQHPDIGGDDSAMQELNAAADAALELLGTAAAPPTPAPPTTSATSRRSSEPSWSGVVQDAPSFTVEALPVEAFEALMVVASWLGQVTLDEPPDVLEAILVDPASCWCRLDLVPDAGACTVTVTVAGIDAPTPDVELIRDAWIDGLNRLDWDDPAETPADRGAPPS
jgi:hypothetical protein